MVRPEIREARSYFYTWPAPNGNYGPESMQELTNVEPKMNESNYKMCSFTLNGQMYMAGGEEYGYKTRLDYTKRARD